MRFLNEQEVRARFEGKRVAIVGSGPGVLTNPAGLIDGHDVVVRVNNYKLMGHATGSRTDVFYSFFGNSIKKTPGELRADGVTLCMAKCPNGKPIESDWHDRQGMTTGTDFRWIYEQRATWWFCDTFVTSLGEFRDWFHLLNSHVPTTGFSAVMSVLSRNPSHVYLTGFDFFRSGIHNLNETWGERNLNDPIRHMPELELAWIRDNMKNFPIACDSVLNASFSCEPPGRLERTPAQPRTRRGPRYSTPARLRVIPRS